MSTPVVTVDIRNIAFGGEGVGIVTAQDDGNEDLLGITAFVPFSAPGEKVSAQVLEHKKRYLKTQLINIEQPTPQRVSPECEYFTVCGGCELQHYSYRSQLESKREMIRSALQAARIGRDAMERIEPVIAGNPYNYRRRVTLHIDPGGRVGFYRANSRSAVPIESCSVAVPEINEALSSIQDFGREMRGKLSSILLEVDDRGLVVVLKSPYALASPEQQEVIAAAKPHFDDVTLMVGEKEVGGYGRQILELPLTKSGSLSLQVPAGSFSQVNWEINQQLISDTLELLEVRSQQTVYDLYAGAGNFTIPFSKQGAKVTAVECDKRLTLFGRENLKRYGLQEQSQFIEQSVERFIAKRAKGDAVDGIIADPPRSGLGQVASQLRGADRLALISCHLPSFVRDLRNLTEHGWQLETIRPYDMFAQTTYTEILSIYRAA